MDVENQRNSMMTQPAEVTVKCMNRVKKCFFYSEHLFCFLFILRWLRVWFYVRNCLFI